MDALDRYHSGTLQGQPLLRAVLAHPRWWLPVAQGPRGLHAALRTDDAGRRWLPVYTADPVDGLFLEVPTRAWVDLLDADLAGVELDPGARHAVHWQRDQFAALREVAHALDVQAILRGDATVPRPWSSLRNHVGWRILVHGDGSGRQLVLAPDAKGRRLAAVFTAADAAAAFLATIDDPDVRVEARAGLPLFADLLRTPLDGVLIDAMGPGAPVAVSMAFVEAVLDGVDAVHVPAVLPARSRAEMELYLDVLGCDPSRPTRAEARDGQPVWVVEATVAGRTRELVFAAPSEAVISGFGGAEPSKILDPAAFLLHGEALVARLGDATDDVAARARAVRLDRAIRCFEEVLKFVPPHANRVPLDSFFSSAGRRLGRTRPERFSRDALVARLAELRGR